MFYMKVKVLFHYNYFTMQTSLTCLPHFIKVRCNIYIFSFGFWGEIRSARVDRFCEFRSNRSLSLFLYYRLCSLVQNCIVVCLQKQLESTDKAAQFHFMLFFFFGTSSAKV